MQCAAACLDRSGCRLGPAEILVDSSRRRPAVTDDKRAHMTTSCTAGCLYSAIQTQAHRNSLQIAEMHTGGFRVITEHLVLLPSVL